jgi:hypothetical protein
MSFTAANCTQGIIALLMNRQVASATRLEATRKAVLELTEDYKHPLLEVNGALVQFTPYVNLYAPTFFTGSGDGLDVSKVNSFFIYNSYYGAPSPDQQNANSGYNLKFRSPDSMEVLWNVPGIPQFWSRSNNQILIGSMPDNAYYCYMRWQQQHPDTDEAANFTDDTQIMMADAWQEILEYAVAMRLAPQVNLSDKKEELHSALYGDQKFQSSSGIDGAPGLIFQRTTQRNRDQATTMRRFRLRMGRV